MKSKMLAWFLALSLLLAALPLPAAAAVPQAAPQDVPPGGWLPPQGVAITLDEGSAEEALLLDGTAPASEDGDDAGPGVEVESLTLDWESQQNTGVMFNCLTEGECVIYKAFVQAAEQCAQMADGKRACLVGWNAYIPGLTEDNIECAFTAFMFDHPESFWCGASYRYMTTNGTIVAAGLSVDPAFGSAAQVQQARQDYENGIQALLREAGQTSNKAAMALRLHDVLVNHVTYDDASLRTNDAMPHTAYNAVVKGTAVCDGYSKAYIDLLSRCGIEATAVTNDEAYHAWNMVKLDNQDADPNNDWYETDVTWDDKERYTIWDYYDLTSDVMASRHGTIINYIAMSFDRDGNYLNPRLPRATGTTFTYEYSQQLSREAAPAQSAQPGVDTTQISAFVTRLYSLCLGRAPRNGEEVNWVNALVSGAKTGSECAYGFYFSQEFTSKNYSNAEYVTLLYRAMMGREPDEGGLQDWVGRLAAGTPREVVFNGFVGSQEFTNLCASYGIVRGDGDGISAFVDRLYRVCFSRGPDVAGFNDWTARLRTQTATGTEVAHGFAMSKEMANLGLNDEQYVEAMYRAFFDREYDDAGKADWLNRMHAQGYDREQVFYGFAGSQEFANLCARYGILR